MDVLDSWVVACLVPLAVAAVLSGLDDLIPDLTMAVAGLRRRVPAVRPPEGPERRIALFVPLWQEHNVIESMLRHNLAEIRYTNYEVFVGAYPNDPLTLEVVRGIESSLDKVHLAIVPHDGPTSKADCLNWIYQAMLAQEEACGAGFEVIVTHDAEDLIHPDSLRWINHYMQEYDMVQVPVLPLPTPGRRLTHGVYCDEFAEFQTKDVPSRTLLGGFLPSNGVGTGYKRVALEALAAAHSNQVFDPTCLTEDYDCGIRLYRLGFRQFFVPVRFLDGLPMATREYFPQRFRQAVRQRTRWVTGIALQGWERHGWRGNPASLYWFWRDRKGLLGNPLSLLGNLISIYCLASWTAAAATGRAWTLPAAGIDDTARWWLGAALVSQGWRMAVRCACAARIYGWQHAMGAPARLVWANWLNAIATVSAIGRYTRARLARRAHVWLKTEHIFPLLEPAAQPPVLPLAHVDVRGVRREAARALPLHVVERWRVLPFEIREGKMLLAATQPPPPTALREISRFTRLEIRLQLVSPQNFERLMALI